MLKVGLFGCGRISQVHAASLTAHPRAELSVVFDPVEEAASSVAERFSTRYVTTAEDILEDESIDAVVIASSTPTHVDLLTRAVEAGKWVLCEKPIDLDLDRVDACRERLGAATDKVMVGFNRRFDASFADVQARVAAGEVGRIEQVTITSRDPLPPPLAYVKNSGGLFKDMMIHDFDMARFLLGDVVEVSAMGTNLVADEIAEAGDVDGAVVVLRGANGATCTITNSRRCAFGYDQRLEAFGEKGQLVVANQWPTSVRFSGADSTEAAAPYLNFFLDRYMPAYATEMDAFITAIEEKRPFSPSFEDGRAALALALAAKESLVSRATVDISL